MPFVDCPHCHISFHMGVIYETLDACPRCGASLSVPRRGLTARFRASGRSHVPPDWEAVTGSQYTRRYVTLIKRDPDDSSPAG